MPEFVVTKILDFCYGHRLLHYEGKCKRLHGHHARVEIELAGESLDSRGMVCDFLEIKKRIEPWINEKLDHKMILHEDDPLVPLLKEAGETPFLMTDNPTAENIARLIFEEAKRLGFPVASVRFWENPDSFATYRGKLNG